MDKRLSINSQSMWNSKYSLCKSQIESLKTDMVLLKHHLAKDRLSEREKEAVQDKIRDITIIIAKNSVDVINLAEFIDSKLDLSLEDANNTEMFQQQQQDILLTSDQAIQKKLDQVQLSKEFKEIAEEFKKLRKQLSKKAALLPEEEQVVDKHETQAIHIQVPPELYKSNHESGEKVGNGFKSTVNKYKVIAFILFTVVIITVIAETAKRNKRN